MGILTCPKNRCTTEALMTELGGSLDDRFCSIEDFASILGERRINPVAVDSLLGPLGRGTYRCDRSFPPLGIDGPPRTQIQNGDIPLDAQRPHGLLEQVANYIVPREPPHRAPVLA